MYLCSPFEKKGSENGSSNETKFIENHFLFSGKW